MVQIECERAEAQKICQRRSDSFFGADRARARAEAIRSLEAIERKAPYAAEVFRRLGGADAEHDGCLYYPNRFDKQGDCKQCDGTVDTGCEFCPEKGVFGDARCWKNSFRSKLAEYDIFLQVIEESGLGEGQEDELRWAQLNPRLDIIRIGE